jgi:hypothetical protein
MGKGKKKGAHFAKLVTDVLSNADEVKGMNARDVLAVIKEKEGIQNDKQVCIQCMIINLLNFSAWIAFTMN